MYSKCLFGRLFSFIKNLNKYNEPQIMKLLDTFIFKTTYVQSVNIFDAPVENLVTDLTLQQEITL